MVGENRIRVLGVKRIGTRSALCAAKLLSLLRSWMLACSLPSARLALWTIFSPLRGSWAEPTLRNVTALRLNADRKPISPLPIAKIPARRQLRRLKVKLKKLVPGAVWVKPLGRVANDGRSGGDVLEEECAGEGVGQSIELAHVEDAVVVGVHVDEHVFESGIAVVGNAVGVDVVENGAAELGLLGVEEEQAGLIKAGDRHVVIGALVGKLWRKLAGTTSRSLNVPTGAAVMVKLPLPSVTAEGSALSKVPLPLRSA